MIRMRNVKTVNTVYITWTSLGWKKNSFMKINLKLEKKYAPALDNYGQSCFVRSDFLKMKCVCKTQMMPSHDHQNPVVAWPSKSCGHAHLHYVYKHPAKY